MPQMIGFVGSTLHVTLFDNREISGTFTAFDKHMNIVLANATERRASQKAPGGFATRPLGFTLLRGEHIIAVRAERQDVTQLPVGDAAAGTSALKGAVKPESRPPPRAGAAA